MRLYTNVVGQFPGLSLSPITVESAFWRGGENRDELPDRDYFIQQCSGEGPLCINVEHWPWDIRTHSHAVADKSLRKLETLTRWAVEAFPGRVVGHYRIFPYRDYWTPQQAKLLHPLRWRQWRRANGYMKKSRDANGRYNGVGLADLCHVTMPSLYTFYEKQDGWLRYAEANIEEARKYGKPIIPVIWPRWHFGGDNLRPDHLKARYGIDGDYWRFQLDSLKDMGITEIAIWDAAGFYASQDRGEVWTEQTPWIAATQQFIEGAK